MACHSQARAGFESLHQGSQDHVGGGALALCRRLPFPSQPLPHIQCFSLPRWYTIANYKKSGNTKGLQFEDLYMYPSRAVEGPWGTVDFLHAFFPNSFRPLVEFPIARRYEVQQYEHGWGEVRKPLYEIYYLRQERNKHSAVRCSYDQILVVSGNHKRLRQLTIHWIGW